MYSSMFSWYVTCSSLLLFDFFSLIFANATIFFVLPFLFLSQMYMNDI